MDYTEFTYSEQLRNVDKLLCECELEVGHVMSEFYVESTHCSVFNESEGLQENRFKEMINKIFDAIKTAISSTASAIQDLFSGKEHIDVYNYLKSNTGKIEMENDLDEVYRKTCEDVAKGNKVIRALARLKGKDAVNATEDFMKAVEGGAVENTAKVISFASAAGYYNKYAKSSVYNTLNEEIDSAKKIAKSIKDKDAQKCAMQVSATMSSIVARGMKTINVGMHEVKREAKRYNRAASVLKLK